MKATIALIFTALLFVFSSCTGREASQTQQEEVTKPKVRIQQVTSRDVEQIQHFTATVEPVVKNNINPSTPGRIRQIFVEVGDQVSKGQRLAQMDALNLQNLESQITNFKRIYERAKELHAVGGASQQELDNARLQVTVAESNLKSLQENTWLISPISGIVTARNFDNGDMFNGQQPILTVMQIHPVQLKIHISETFFSRVKRGMKVNVTLDVYEGETFEGQISLVYPTIDERTRTFPVEVSLRNPGGKIRPGMFARVAVNFGSIQRVVVPDRSVIKQTGSGARFIYVYSDGIVNYKQVELGRRIDTEYELVSGVENGSWVVVAGQSNLEDDLQVEAVQLK